MLARRSQVAAGRAIVLTICAMHLVLGVSLVITAPELWLSAVFEFGLALAVILAILLGERRGVTGARVEAGRGAGA